MVVVSWWHVWVAVQAWRGCEGGSARGVVTWLQQYVAAAPPAALAPSGWLATTSRQPSSQLLTLPWKSWCVRTAGAPGHTQPAVASASGCVAMGARGPAPSPLHSQHRQPSPAACRTVQLGSPGSPLRAASVCAGPGGGGHPARAEPSAGGAAACPMQMHTSCFSSGQMSTRSACGKRRPSIRRPSSRAWGRLQPASASLAVVGGMGASAPSVLAAPPRI
jgi:hypothetical protein